ncbi:MAG: CDP-alcohol phosphatidyltransferase family protein [Gemmatimonadetes bacterium]|nr:CDP-alcohol phosphatidyltransferase family protein [Gemmatimonadota bacterium]
MQATGGLGGEQARPWVRPPDVLTALRVPLAAAFLVTDRANLRLAILGIAAVTDVIDGMWARRLGGSRVGVVLDPVCDKLFMAVAFWVVYRSGALTGWEIGGILVRDILAALAFLGTLVLGHPTTLPARAGGKAVTVCQLLALAAFVTGSDLLRPLAWATAAIAVYAIADYTRLAWRL